MARHESEMHRQRRELFEALRRITRCASIKGPAGTTAYCISDKHMAQARAIVQEIESTMQPQNGLFGDHSQMDLADRKDLA